MTQQTYQQFSDAFIAMLNENTGNRKHVVYAKKSSRSDLGGSTPALDRVSWSCSLFMIDFLCRLIARQDSFANRHSLQTSRRRRITRAHRQGSPQLGVSSGRQLSVGGPFVAPGAVCTDDEERLMGAHQIRQSVASRKKPEFTSFFFFPP